MKYIFVECDASKDDGSMGDRMQNQNIKTINNEWLYK